MDKHINGLRIIQTLRDVSETNINDYIDKGYRVVIRKLEPLQDLYITKNIYRHKETKKIVINGVDPRSWTYVNDLEYELLEKITFYPYYFEQPYAAYLVPQDVQVNEEVFLSDLIEDYIGDRHHRNYRLKSCEAIWNGKDLEILYTKEKQHFCIG